MPRNLRIEGETDTSFTARCERAAERARVMIDAALANRSIRRLIADPIQSIWTEEGQRQSPTVRIEYEQAICIAGIGEGLAATRNKHWGNGPWIAPLKPNDPVDPMFVLYVYRENSVYHRRFIQRLRMKELLGRRYRYLVEKAKYHRHTKAMFLESLRGDEAAMIRYVFGVEPGEFWRAARGKTWLKLPQSPIQREFAFLSDDEDEND